MAFIAAASPISALVGADPINPAARAFVHGLRDLEYFDGKNLILEMRSEEGRFLPLRQSRKLRQPNNFDSYRG